MGRKQVDIKFDVIVSYFFIWSDVVSYCLATTEFSVVVIDPEIFYVCISALFIYKQVTSVCNTAAGL